MITEQQATEQQQATDQAVCRLILEGLQKVGYENRLHLGDRVHDLDIITRSDERTRIASAEIEQRHIDAVETFRQNYPLGYDIASVNLRIQPPIAKEEPV